MRNESEFIAFAEANATRLRQIAYLMCRDWHLAQDLTQTALTKMYVHWNKVSRDQGGDPFRYARKVLLNSLLDHRRRLSSTELTVEQLPDRPAAGGDRTATRLTLLEALDLLSKRDRAIVLLRYWEDQSVEATAEILGLSTSVVKSQSARAMTVLRRHLGQDGTLLHS
ncbi:sigma-70 family RNA polymerase sigma factor [Kitasatospora sp. LaBMicrA B282]|uniref:sigma-70 family RNA polymerase sigma factor n=1 Tax=Kitasatospora sp. LaBMicrA B282 TaxID=3420949 RepID=UPI003D10FE9A